MAVIRTIIFQSAAVPFVIGAGAAVASRAIDLLTIGPERKSSGA